MNASRRKALEILAEGPLTEWQRVTIGVQHRTLAALCDAGLAKYRPFGNPPSWAITKQGREELAPALID